MAERVRQAVRWMGVALLPVALYFVLLAWRGLYPFGDESFLTEDLWYQYVDFYTWFRRVLLGEARLGYTASLSLGVSAWGIFSYYLSSPVNLLVLFFDPEHMTLAVVVICAIKLSLIQLSATWWLERRFGLPRSQAAALGLCLACSGWVIADLGNPLWLDVCYLLPPAMLGAWRYLREGGVHRVAIPAACTIMTCWYMGYMACVYLCLYVLLETWCLRRDEPGLLKGRLLRRAAGFAAALILGVGLAAWSFLPTVLVMARDGAATDFAPRDLIGLADLASGLFAGSYQFELTPQLFCGSVALVLAVCFLLDRRIAGHRRLGALVLVALLLASTWVSTLYFAWCGFREPNGFYCRMAFTFAPTVLWMAGSELSARANRGISAVEIGLPVGLLLAVQLILMVTGCFWRLSYCVLSCALTVCAGAVAWAVISEGALMGLVGQGAGDQALQAARGQVTAGKALQAARGQGARRGLRVRSAASVALLVFCFLDLSLGAYLMLGVDKRYQGHSESAQQAYVEESAAQLAALRSADPGVWRMDKTYSRAYLAALNEGLAQGYLQLSSYSSSYDPAAVRLLCALGYSRTGEFSVRYGAPLVTSDALLGVRYALVGDARFSADLYGETSGVPEREGVRVLRNPYALSLGYCVSEDVLSLGYDASAERPFELQNALFSALVGHEVEVFESLDLADLGGDSRLRSWRVTGGEAPVYLYVSHGEDGQADAFLSVDGNEPLCTGQRFEHAVYPAGVGDHVVTLAADEAAARAGLSEGSGQGVSDEQTLPEGMSLQAAALNAPAFEEAIAELADEQLELSSFADGHVEGSVEASSDGWLLLTIPHAKGWSAQVNGQPVEIVGALGDAFMALPVRAGRNDVVLDFQVPGLVAGCVVSVATAAILAISYLLWRRRVSQGPPTQPEPKAANADTAGA